MPTRPIWGGVCLQLTAHSFQCYRNWNGTLEAIGNVKDTPRRAMEDANAVWRAETDGKSTLTWVVVGREDLY